MSLNNTSLFGVILTLLLTLGVGEMWAGAGWWNNGGVVLKFDLNGSEISRTLNSGSAGGATSLGTVTTSMKLKTFTANVWKDGGNICSAEMYYQVKNSGGTVVLDKSGTATSASWKSNSGNNQVWEKSSINVDLLNGGLAPGTYTFVCWFKATGNASSSSGCGTTWWYSNNSQNYSYTFTVPSKNLTVAGATNGNTVSGNVTGITKGTAYTITATPTTGYNFGGWSATSGSSSISIGNTSSASTTVTFSNYSNNATVTASFTPKTTTITLNNVGATTAGTTEVIATYGEDMPAITVPTKTGYTFGGYWGAPGGNGPKLYNADGSSNATWGNTESTYTLYAAWSENKSTVTLVASPSGKGTFQVGGETVTSTLAGVATTPAVTAMAISGYRFSSWSITGGASISSTTDNPTTVTGGGAGTAATLTATFVEDLTYYTLQFGARSGETSYGSVTAVDDSDDPLTSSSTYLSGTSVTLTATATDDDYKFDSWYPGWITGDPVSTENPLTFSLSADTKRYAHFVQKTTSITLNKGIGSGGTAGPVTATHGNTTLSTNPLVNPAKSGYTFTGYWTASSGGVKVIDTDGTLVASVSGYTKSGNKKWDYDDPTLTLYAQWEEKMSTLTTSNSYDAGDPSYAIPTKTKSSIGIATTATLTATTPGTGYTFAGWTLSSNLVVTSGNAATDLSITVRTNGNGAAATAQANYAEDRSTTWTIAGSFNSWNTSSNPFVKPSGGSTGNIAYCTLSLAASTTYTFQVVEGGSNWKGNTSTITGSTNDLTFVAGSYNDCTINTSEAGDYTFKIDFSTAATPSISVTFPPSVYLTSDNESAYADGSVTLTAEGANLVSGSKTIEYEFFKGNNTLPANKIGSTQTFNSITATTHSTTQSVSPEFSTSDYAALQIYTVKMTVNGGTPYTNTITIYRKWDINVRDAFSWGQMKLFTWGANGENAGYPGTLCSNISGNWYTVTLSSKYEGFLLSADGDATKTTDLEVGDYAEGTSWYVTANSNGTLTAVVAPTVEIRPNDAGTYVVNTNQLRLTAEITNFGNDGTRARDMVEVGFMIGETKYPIPSSCTSEENGWFWGGITGLTAGTTYNVKAYATNFAGTAISANTATLTTRAAGTTTIHVRTAVGDEIPKVYAWTSNDCGGAFTENASYPGASMGEPVVTGTIYKWYSYNISNEFNQFVVCHGANAAAADLVKTDDFDNPFTETCYWYSPTENNEEGHKRMGSMSCPSFDPQLMINGGGSSEEYTYFDMVPGDAANEVKYVKSLAAKTTYKFKPVYNAEWYTKASTSLTRASYSATGLTAADGDNIRVTTDVAGNYTFVFNTSTKALRVEFPTAYTVTFGYGTGGSAVTASATTAGGALTSGDYVAAGDEITFTQTPATGYTFKGWYTTADGNTTVGTMGESDNELNDIAANATVYAQYTPNEYTVTFDATTNGGTCGTASKRVTFDAAYGDLPEATKDAKVFAGWYTTASGAGIQVTAETIVSNAANHTIYARFEDTYSVTIQYKSGDVTLKPNGSTTASETALAPEITAPEFLGYTFTGWTGTSATFANASSATTTVNVTAATTITANYSAIPTVYFKNNLGWEHVYVTFDAYFGEAGGATVPGQNGKPYFEMTQMGESDIFSCVIPDAIVSSWKTNIAFDNKGYASTDNVGTYGLFYQGEFIGRGDFASEATMFIPYNGDKEGRNGGTYYRTGCWMKYNSTDPGYKVYANTYKEGSGGSAVAGTPVLLTADIAGGYEFKATVNFPSANYTYGFMLKKEATSNTNNLWYTNTSDIYASTTTLPWDFTSDGASENGRRCGLHTEATGNYEITVSFATGKPMVNVTYPVSTNDWRLVYKDRATWSNGAHTAAWQHPSRVIKAKADAEDIVSFYVSKAVGANATVELQKCTAIDPGTGAQTWEKLSDVDLSAITETGIYNFKVTQNGSKIASAAFDGGYVGNFYIRTDASDGGWSNYKTSGTNTMTYSEYSLDHGGEFGPYSHYFMRYVTAGSNIKFCIANDYSECISDTIVGDTYTGEYIAASGNVRFMWYWETNKIGRAYISGSSIISDRFLVLEGDDKMFNEAGTALTTAAGGKVTGLNEYEMKFTDDQNWIYEATVQAQPEARFKLTAKYNNKVQYFYGDEDATEQLLGGNGESTTKYTIRIVYDFKTNRLIKAFIPSGTITENLSIEADLMIIREHQEDAQQINFTGSGALSDVKTVYGAMKFNKWTVNGKEKTGGHATTSDSRYKRDLFYISFPFDVKLSDVFGFGTYGKHWIIEYYDGKGRAKNGFWADSDSYWKFVLPSQRSSFTLKAFEGYILALDLDEMTEGSSIWNNDVQDVYVYFPSSAAVEDIQATNRLITIDQEGYQCQIGPRFEGGEDRRVKDSYWHVIGVPSFANYNNPLTETNGGTAIDWRDDDGKIWETPSLPYLYEWNSADNSLTVTTSATFNFKATYSYMVQYAGTSIYWSAVNATPSSVVARKNDNQPTSAEFRLELQQGEEKADQTFVRLTDEENVTTGFDFNYDLSKEMNANKANIFTMITTAMSDGNTVTESAANCLPMSGQTTVVPVGVKIAADGDYTFAIPEGTEGVGVTLIDQETGIRTSLSALAYTVTLEAGTYDERFVLEISPIHNVPTEQSAVSDQQSDVRKVLIDGLLYIVRDNKMYDARGAMVMEK